MFAVLSLALFNTLAFGQREIVFLTPEKEGMKGNVKEVKMYECEIDYENHSVLRNKKKLSSDSWYNHKGYIEKKTHIIGNVQSNTNYQYVYDKDRISIIDINSYDTEDGIQGNVKKIKVTYDYDKEGRTHQITALDVYQNQEVYFRYFHYTTNGELFIDDFERDRSPMLSGRYKIDDDHPLYLHMSRGKNIIRHSYVYNDAGQKTADKILNNHGDWSISVSYEYDDKGNVTKQTNYREDGTVLNEYYYSYKYDTKGNWMEKETKYSDIGFTSRCEIREITYYK